MIRIEQALDRCVFVGSDIKNFCLLILMIITIVFKDL